MKRPRRPWLAPGTLLLGITWTATAYGDAVPPPPMDCPAGTTASTCHGGPHCRVRTCASDAECTGGTVCRELRLCVRSLTCGGLRPPDSAPPPAFPVASSACEGAGACALGTCQATRACAPP
ncbi:MAG: hypothetical protein HY909_22005, partial [Deltaproteobacteria bacterium]|nr:hypothetical protein [Deltaproteobacteria bacterium]